MTSPIRKRHHYNSKHVADILMADADSSSSGDTDIIDVMIDSLGRMAEVQSQTSSGSHQSSPSSSIGSRSSSKKSSTKKAIRRSEGRGTQTKRKLIDNEPEVKESPAKRAKSNDTGNSQPGLRPRSSSRLVRKSRLEQVEIRTDSSGAVSASSHSQNDEVRRTPRRGHQ